jgi:hypothetical protein
MMRPFLRAGAALAASAAALLAVAGCGEKIAIPVAEGVWGVQSYVYEAAYEDPDAVDLIAARGALLVVTPDAVIKRDLSYNERDRVGGLESAARVCLDDSSRIGFVYERAAPPRITWFDFDTMDVLGSQNVPEIVAGGAMATSTRGIEEIPGARTFLYIVDSSAGVDLSVIRRYVFDVGSGLTPWGILSRSGGAGARFVNVPSGLARDSEGMILACDADSTRHWVIRFDPSPDYDDTTPLFDGMAPWRGTAITFAPEVCEPAAAAEYVLGNAAECEETDWVAGPSDANGEFDVPRAAAIDGRGGIYVADQNNDRFQIFDSLGVYSFQHGNPDDTPRPLAIGLVDVKYDSGDEDVFYGGEVFLLVALWDGVGEYREVRRFLSADYSNWDNTGPPPPPQ